MHRRQIQFYLCASGIQSGLLINFGNAKTIECERYEWIDSGYQVPERPHIPDVHAEKPPVPSRSGYGRFSEQMQMREGVPDVKD